MAAEKADVLLIGPPKRVIVNGLTGAFNVVKLPDAKERDKFFSESGPRVRAMAVVVTEEVADTAIGLLLCTVREFPQAERYLRAGKWPQKNYPLSKATLRDRTVGMVGLGRIGQAIARRLEAM